MNTTFWLVGPQQLSNCTLPLELKPGVYLIGRLDGCTVCLRDSSVSRGHAKISVASGGVLSVEDLQSRNGVAVNGELISTAYLRVGDRLRVGAVELMIASSPLCSLDEEESTVGLTSANRARVEPVTPLTPRQNQVLQLLLLGLDERQIASQILCQPRTVHNHIQAVYRSYDVSSRQQLMALLLRGRVS